MTISLHRWGSEKKNLPLTKAVTRFLAPLSPLRPFRFHPPCQDRNWSSKFRLPSPDTPSVFSKGCSRLCHRSPVINEQTFTEGRVLINIVGGGERPGMTEAGEGEGVKRGQ
nr:hypothetical protein BgiMline_002652 [Biomphalaria glabrata]